METIKAAFDFIKANKWLLAAVFGIGGTIGVLNVVPGGSAIMQPVKDAQAKIEAKLVYPDAGSPTTVK
ncbi:hypothetical protein [Mesorhizobium sp. M8A.F.Ca.ET.165.01.1.1]|uniref:hypothetical protein n=1 Tax=Mesorhizobium sp. M8A.F.Ca.ET.165.01.1.1 TaxID=2563960 RepID=UPI001093A553|nr:hypothetical protein [Mesorhizobium sp. M8A.F.Ca.ET.165.01.1.1]TGT42788.1 hypothetical protein EN808_12970 [Mesorhizobium sp. M8A.F.Ca.ET.165.01.1.1]